MFSAISGLRAHQTKMDVTGNNIANVNTVGFKGSQTVFQDTLSQVIRAGGAPAADRGGTNPAQVGLGVKVAAVTTNWTQGATQSTGRSTDFMIEGDGFFVTRSEPRTSTPARARSTSTARASWSRRPVRSCRAGWPTPPASSTPMDRSVICPFPTARS
jgi:flagellar hook protein FlgE